ncbi:MAG: carbohydrate ABC transporter permease [Christensenella sp.]
MKRNKASNKIKQNKGFNFFMYLVVGAFAVFCFVPFWLVFINSFATETSIAQNGFSLWPSEFTFYAYEYAFAGGQVGYGYRNTFFIVLIGTPIATIITAMFAYVLAHPKVKYRKIMSFLTYLSMIMGTALVGYYVLISSWLHLKDNLWAIILPMLFNPFFAFIMVAAYKDVPYEIYEASCIDGAGDILTFFKVILPIVLPTIATVALFYTLQYWNEWWHALLFIDNYKLHPLQMLIRSLISSINTSSYMGARVSSGALVPTNSVKMAVVCLTVGPIILGYPFAQKYFVEGISVGAVKG